MVRSEYENTRGRNPERAKKDSRIDTSFDLRKDRSVVVKLTPQHGTRKPSESSSAADSTSSRQAGSLQEILRRRGIVVDSGDSRRSECKEKFGCVVRAVESVTQAAATDEETDQRLDVVREENEKYINALVSDMDSPTFKAFVVKEIEADRSNVRDYYHSLHGNDTPLGKALRNQKMTERDLSPTEIRDEIAQERQVILVGGLRNPTGEWQGSHAAHIGHDDQQGFISISDGGIPQKLQPDVQHHCYVFDKKTPNNI